MDITHQYFYRKWKVVTAAVIYTILSVIFVAFGVYSYVHWEMSFLFTDWKGYVILIVYSLISLGMILSAVEAFRKVRKVQRGIPAFAVAPDRFIVFDRNGLANTILFEDCDKVRFKRNIRYRGAPPTLTLIITHHEKSDPLITSRVEINLNELDQSQWDIDKQLNKVYKAYKKNSPAGPDAHNPHP